MPKNYNHPALDTPVTGARRSLFSFNGDAVGAGAEKVARFLGTGKYLAWQTLIVVVWICLNIGGMWWNWDPYPFILLNLAFSTQAAYAAPLILLAQNRQDDRDRVTAEQDRQRAQRNLEDTEFLTREIAALRLAMNDVATRDFVRSELRDMLSEILAEERLTREEIAEFQDSGDDESDTAPEQRTAQ